MQLCEEVHSCENRISGCSSARGTGRRAGPGSRVLWLVPCHWFSGLSTSLLGPLSGPQSIGPLSLTPHCVWQPGNIYVPDDSHQKKGSHLLFPLRAKQQPWTPATPTSLPSLASDLSQTPLFLNTALGKETIPFPMLGPLPGARSSLQVFLAQWLLAHSSRCNSDLDDCCRPLVVALCSPPCQGAHCSLHSTVFLTLPAVLHIGPETCCFWCHSSNVQHSTWAWPGPWLILSKHARKKIREEVKVDEAGDRRRGRKREQPLLYVLTWWRNSPVWMQKRGWNEKKRELGPRGILVGLTFRIRDA
jgi:hypothetical protein